jgi:hypothetical protein
VNDPTTHANDSGELLQAAQAILKAIAQLTPEEQGQLRKRLLSRDARRAQEEQETVLRRIEEEQRARMQRSRTQPDTTGTGSVPAEQRVMTQATKSRLDEIAAIHPAIDESHARSNRAALLEHARMGQSVPESRDGQVVWISPEEIFARYGLDPNGKPLPPPTP